MKLFGRKSGATLALTPSTPLRAAETVTATVTIPDALDKVTAATVELGYVNGYRYRWAGRGDAAFNYPNDSLVMMDQVGTNYGTDKDTEDWVHVLDAPLATRGGVLAAGEQTVQLRIPSWAPGSSKEVVRWQVRLHVDRAGKDVREQALLTVLVAAPESAPADLPLIQGERAIANTLEFEVVTERACYRPGDEVRGIMAVTPREPVTRTAKIEMWFQRLQDSHPLEKNPGLTIEAFTPRPLISIAKNVQLVQGQRAEFPFAATLPAGIDPTTEAVHSSIRWFVQVKVEFSGATGGIERAQRGIVVYTA